MSRLKPWVTPMVDKKSDKTENSLAVGELTRNSDLQCDRSFRGRTLSAFPQFALRSYE